MLPDPETQRYHDPIKDLSHGHPFPAGQQTGGGSSLHLHRPGADREYHRPRALPRAKRKPRNNSRSCGRISAEGISTSTKAGCVILKKCATTFRPAPRFPKRAGSSSARFSPANMRSNRRPCSILPSCRIPDQNGLGEGDLRFIMSLRATGEGHISSIEFRAGVIRADDSIRNGEGDAVCHAARTQPEPRLFTKPPFSHKLNEMGLENDWSAAVMGRLQRRPSPLRNWKVACSRRR